MKLGSIKPFIAKSMQPPSSEAVDHAIDTLFALVSTIFVGKMTSKGKLFVNVLNLLNCFKLYNLHTPKHLAAYLCALVHKII